MRPDLRDETALRAYYEMLRPALLQHEPFARALAQIDLGPRTQRLEDRYEVLVAEAATGLRLIAAQLREGLTALEVGGGAGLLHLWLRRGGLDVTSLEPALVGHAGAFEAAHALLAHQGVSTTAFLPLRGEEASSLGRRFDLIFSNNVLEHVGNLEALVAALARCLAPGGVMRHNCPNYAVPYDPHYSTPLVPLAPRATAWLVPGLRGEPLFEGLRFITARDLRALGAQHGLSVTFDRGMVGAALRRIAHEPQFAAKHRLLASALPALERLGALKLASLWPGAWGTPMQSTWQAAAPNAA